MDFQLLSSPLPKPWCNIEVNNLVVNNQEVKSLDVIEIEADEVKANEVVANRFRIVGDGSFGSNGTVVSFTGTVPGSVFNGYAPNPNPTIAANTLYVGSEFIGEFTGTVVTPPGAILVIDFRFNGVIVIRIQTVLAPIAAPTAFKTSFVLNARSIGPAGSIYGQFTSIVGNSPGTIATYQSEGTNAINTTIPLVIDTQGQWSNANVGNILRIENMWFRRVI